MASIAKFDQWQNSAGVAYNTPIQIVSSTYKDSAAYNVTTIQTWPISATITPRFSSSKIFVMFEGWCQPASELYGQVYLYRNGSRVTDLSNNGTAGSNLSNIAGGVCGLSMGSNNQNNQGRFIGFSGYDNPASTSALTYDIRCHTPSSTYMSYYIGRNTSGWTQAGILTLTLIEVAQ